VVTVESALEPMKPISEQYELAYAASNKIDAEITNLVKHYPPEQNPYFWIKFFRTVNSSISILNEVAKTTLKMDKENL
jgi:hypothetical protein